MEKAFWKQIKFNLYRLIVWGEAPIDFTNYNDLYNYCIKNEINAAVV